jgi:hypothetical protein
LVFASLFFSPISFCFFFFWYVQLA